MAHRHPPRGLLIYLWHHELGLLPVIPTRWHLRISGPLVGLIIIPRISLSLSLFHYGCGASGYRGRVCMLGLPTWSWCHRSLLSRHHHLGTCVWIQLFNESIQSQQGGWLDGVRMPEMRGAKEDLAASAIRRRELAWGGKGVRTMCFGSCLILYVYFIP